MTLRVCVGCMLVAFTCGAAESAGPKGRAFGLGRPYDSFAFNRETGDLLAVDSREAAVTLYPKAYLDGTSKDIVGPVSLENRNVKWPDWSYLSDACFKRWQGRSYWVVASKWNERFHVLEAATLKRVSEIKLGQKLPSRLSSPDDPDSPYVYYESFGTIRRVRLDAMRESRTMSLRDRGYAVSPDGRTLYAPNGQSGLRVYRSATAVQPAEETDPQRRIVVDGTNVAEVTQGGFALERKSTEGESGRFCVVDGGGRYVAAGRSVFAADSARLLATLDADVSAFMPRAGIILAAKEMRLTAYSYETLGPWKEVDLERSGFDLPEKLDEATEGRRQEEAVAPAECFLDEARSRVIVARCSWIYVAPLALLGVGDVRLDAGVPGIPAGVVGRRMEIPLSPPDARCTIALAEGPAGMKLEGKRLVWTPASSDVPKSAAVLALSGGGMERTETLPLAAEFPSVRLSFEPQAVALSPSGRTAIAWSAGRTYGEGDEKVGRVAVIDVAGRRLVAQKTLSYRMCMAVTDDRLVYVAPQGEARVDVLRATDLALERQRPIKRSRADVEEEQRGFSPSTPVDLAVVGSSWLAVGGEDGVTTYRLGDLEEVVTLATTDGRVGTESLPVAHPWELNWSRGYRSWLPLQLSDGWLVGPVVLDDDLKKVRMIAGGAGLPSLDNPNREGEESIPNPTQLQKEWSSYEGPQPGMLFLRDYPGIVRLHHVRGGSESRLELHSVWQYVPCATFQLRGERGGEESYRPDPPGRRAPVAAKGDTLVALAGTHVFICPLDAKTLGKLLSRPTFEMPREVAVVGRGASVRTSFPVKGGSGSYTWALGEGGPGVRVDAKTGEVTLDGREMERPAFLRIIEALEDVCEHDSETDERVTLRKALAKAAASWRSRASALAGRPIEGIPVMAPIALRVDDGQGGRSEMRCFAVFDLPEKALLAPLGPAADRATDIYGLRSTLRDLRHRMSLPADAQDSFWYVPPPPWVRMYREVGLKKMVGIVLLALGLWACIMMVNSYVLMTSARIARIEGATFGRSVLVVVAAGLGMFLINALLGLVSLSGLAMLLVVMFLLHMLLARAVFRTTLDRAATAVGLMVAIDFGIGFALGLLLVGIAFLAGVFR